MPHPKTLKLLALLLGMILISTGVLARSPQATPAAPGSAPAAAVTGQAKTPAAKPDANADPTSAEACKVCHEELYNGWEKSPHWKTTLNAKEGPTHQGCQGCHGSVAEHLADPTDTSKLFLFEKASAKEVNERCLTCHAGGEQHMSAINSEHAKNNVSCISCHAPHQAAAKEFLLSKKQPELCYTCHLQQKAQFEMPFHHRVNEGLIQCSDCHNVHGTVKPKQVRTSSTQDVVCFTCHTDKQGPFVFEHEAVKLEGCQSCHVFHGGPNAHMLKVSNVNLLCLQCHTQSSFSGAPGTPSFHNQNTFFQACTLCHSQIHGSNFDQTFFK